MRILILVALITKAFYKEEAYKQLYLSFPSVDMGEKLVRIQEELLILRIEHSLRTQIARDLIHSMIGTDRTKASTVLKKPIFPLDKSLYTQPPIYKRHEKLVVKTLRSVFGKHVDVKLEFFSKKEAYKIEVFFNEN